MRVLVFGASTTQGFWDTEGGWVQRLRKHYDTLEIKDLSDKQPTIFNLGISGDTSKRLLKRFQPETEARIWPNEKFSFIFNIGANDSAIQEGKEHSTPSTYKRELNQLITKANHYSSKILFIGLAPCDEKLTTPVAWKKDLHYTNKRIFEFETTMRQVVTNYGIPYVPVFEIFQKRLESGENLFADGLHPSNEGHELIFQLVRPELDKLIAQ